MNVTNSVELLNDWERHSDPSESERHQLLVAKCGALAALFGATIIVGAIPFILNCYFKWDKNSGNTRTAKVIQALLYFGGGVLLSTTFLHLLPEIQEVVENLQYCNMIPSLSFALPELLMCAGFFLMYILDEIIHKCVHKFMSKNKEEADAAFERGHSVRKSHLIKAKNNNNEETADLPQKSMENHGTISIITDAEYAMPSNNHNELNHHFDHEHHCHNHGHTHMPVTNVDGSHPSPLRGLLIVLALSMHELFEGMAIGLEGEAAHVWYTFVGVVVHKLVLAFCVGVELIISRTRPCLAGTYMFTFAIVSPIGIFIGIMITHNSGDPDAPSLVSAILQGVATGTLLYVVFFEILSKNHAGYWAFVAMLVGFCLMFGLQQIAHDHDGTPTCGVSSDTITTTINPNST